MDDAAPHVLRLALPTAGTGNRSFYDWLATAPGRPVLGGGADAIAGFDHPGRYSSWTPPRPGPGPGPVER